jgi:hypothetical protein
MKMKLEASNLNKSFVKMVEAQFKSKIKCIRKDNGNEFLIKDFYSENGGIRSNFL